MNHLKISPLSLGLALGIFWGVSVLIMGLLASFFAFGDLFVTSMGTIYIGYEATVLGSIIGGVIGFIDAFFMGLIIAWLYNWLAK